MVAAKTAAKPAAKVADEIDLLADMEDAKVTTVDDDEDFDLLSDMSESDAQAWIPWDDEETPEGIQGKLVHIGTVTQDAKYGGNEVPYWELESSDGTIWGVRGYATVLANQMEREQDKGLRTGDVAAVKHLGLTMNKSKTNEYRNFVVKTKHIGH
jgi:hypothetical protein